MVKLTGLFSQLTPAKVMVVGDLLLDAYVLGKAGRISPEAPVPVVHVEREEHRPGGAGNVMLNLISLGATVIGVGRVGDDFTGRELVQSLSEEGIDIQGVMTQEGYRTPIKQRVVVNNQQVVRIDRESIVPLEKKLEERLIELLPQLLTDVKIIAISDYGKGFLSRHLLQEMIVQGRKRGIPVIADPKGADFTKYRGATILKPNLKETYSAAKASSEVTLEEIAPSLIELANVDTLMVTRSEEGISVFHRDGTTRNFPVKAKEVKDVTGAGDTVLAALARVLASGLSLAEAVHFSNHAAGIAIERFGCARVSLSDLARKLLMEDPHHKVFDGDHLFALQEALRGRAVVLLIVSADEGFGTAMFKAIRSHSQAHQDLLVYVKGDSPETEFVTLLASLHEVRFILLETESLKFLSLTIPLKEVWVVENNSCYSLESLHELMEVKNFDSPELATIS